MNRRSFMSALGAALGLFGLSKLVQAEEKPVYRYAKFFRNCDQVTMDEFKDIVFIDSDGAAHKVPVIWATDEKVENYLNIKADIDDIKALRRVARLPLISIYRGDIFFNEKIHSYYHLTATTIYEESMNQILEQIVVKFHPKFRNKVGEYSLMSMINNYYPGGSAASVNPDAAMRGEIFSAAKWGKQGEWVLYNQYPQIRVLKHQFNLILAIEGRP